MADYLPNDPEVVEWHERHTELERKHSDLIEARDMLPNPDENLSECITYEGPFGRRAQLAYSEANLLNALEGKGAGSRNRVTGGISGVL